MFVPTLEIQDKLNIQKKKKKDYISKNVFVLMIVKLNFELSYLYV